MSDTFLSAWRRNVRDAVMLVRITPRDPVTLNPTTAIRLSGRVVSTPAGTVEPRLLWSGGLLATDPISAPGEFGGATIQLCSTTITVVPSALPTTNLYDGAKVEMWLWEESLTNFDDALLVFTGEVLSLSYDATAVSLQLRQRAGWNRTMTPVLVTQDKYPHAPDSSMGQAIPIVYGRLRAVPLRRPHSEYPLIAQGATALGDKGVPLMLGGQRVGAAILVDTGRGSGMAGNPAAKVLCASHPVSRIADHTVGAGFYLDTGTERLAALDAVVPGTDIINAANEAGLLLRDNTASAWMAVFPTEVVNVSNSAENVRALLDPNHETNYAKLDWTAGYKQARLLFPSVEPLGEIVNCIAVVCYRAPVATQSFTGTNGIVLRQVRLSDGSTTDHVMPLQTGRNWYMVMNDPVAGNGAMPKTPWNFSETEWSIGWDNRNLSLHPALTGTGAAELYVAGWLVNFRPRQEVVLSERVISHTDVRPVTNPRSGRTFYQPYTVNETLPEVNELGGKFFANVDGWADSLGTYAPETIVVKFGTAVVSQFTVTFANAPDYMLALLDKVSAGDPVVAASGGPSVGGTVSGWNATTKTLSLSLPNATSGLGNDASLTIELKSQLLRRAPDIAAHMLGQYGGELASNIEFGVGAWGSFVDARAGLVCRNGLPMDYALSVDRTTDVMTAIAWLSQGSLSSIFVDRFTNKWMYRPWLKDAPTDYNWKFRPQDIIGPNGPGAERTPLSRLNTGIQVSYSYSAKDGQSLHTARLGWDGSTSGYKWRNTRDGRLLVDSTNNKLNFKLNGIGGTFTATIASADYADVAALMQAVSTAMKTADPAREYIACCGATIIANYNDQLQWNAGGDVVSDKTITLDPGFYTFAELCSYLSTLCTSVLELSGGNRDVLWAYSPTTRKVSFQRVALGMTVYGNSITNMRHRRLLATLGFDQTAGNQFAVTYPTKVAFEREDDTFVVGCSTLACDLMWQTGAAGLDGTRTSANAVLGYEGLRDSIGIGATPALACHLADGPKRPLEAIPLKSAQRYGVRRDTIIDARMIQDSDTARELLRRSTELFCPGRVSLNFATEVAPDIRRTAVFEMSGDFDSVMPYPDPDSDGSWVGKRFVVVETEQQSGPVAFYTRIRAVSLD